ncbi:MAG: RNA polymerase [Epulopiscium sp. Nele67-Bin004]|nr:MAG: RNA polymerase [Epulopiscium sp. Nele67-Bin004]
MNEEILLIKRVQKGDVHAYEQLIKNYESKIYNLCMKILKDEQYAYDASQEVCLKIWKQIGKFEGNSKFSTWVYRIASNQCLDMLRKNRNVVHFNGDDDEWLLEVEDKTQNIVEHIENVELQNTLKIALDELKEDYRDIIILRDVKEYSYDQISDKLGVSLGTVKSRLSRARSSLKKILLQDKEPFKSFWSQNNIGKGR